MKLTVKKKDSNAKLLRRGRSKNGSRSLKKNVASVKIKKRPRNYKSE